MSASPTAALLATLQSAEAFIAGFEDDSTQEPPVAPLLAQLRAHITAPTYTHQIQPAVVARGRHAHQRRYGPDAYSGTRATQHRDEVSPAAEVYRNAADDLAEITLRIGFQNSAEISICYTPEQLRELAGRLLDAAADIEANPAAALAAEGGAA